MKYYCYPTYVGLELLVIKLDDSKLSMEFHPPNVRLARVENSPLVKSLEGFVELNIKDILALIETRCSKEEKDRFLKEYMDMTL